MSCVRRITHRQRTDHPADMALVAVVSASTFVSEIGQNLGRSFPLFRRPFGPRALCDGMRATYPCRTDRPPFDAGPGGSNADPPSRLRQLPGEDGGVIGRARDLDVVSAAEALSAIRRRRAAVFRISESANRASYPKSGEFIELQPSNINKVGRSSRRHGAVVSFLHGKTIFFHSLPTRLLPGPLGVRYVPI